MALSFQNPSVCWGFLPAAHAATDHRYHHVAVEIDNRWLSPILTRFSTPPYMGGEGTYGFPSRGCRGEILLLWWMANGGRQGDERR
jgi:hypothetical protein